MTTPDVIKRHLTRSPLIAVTIYLALMTALAAVIWGAIADALEHRSAVAAARAFLEQMERRKPTSVDALDGGTVVPPGSALLEGPTVTVAGAALLQRVAAAVTK